MPETLSPEAQGIVDEIQRLNKEQFEEWEPKIQKAIAAGESHAELDAKSAALRRPRFVSRFLQVGRRQGELVSGLHSHPHAHRKNGDRQSDPAQLPKPPHWKKNRTERLLGYPAKGP